MAQGPRGRYAGDDGEEDDRRAAAAAAEQMRHQAAHQQQGYASGSGGGRAGNGYGGGASPYENGGANGYGGSHSYQQEGAYGSSDPYYGAQSAPSPPALRPAGGGAPRRLVSESPASEEDSGSTVYRPGAAPAPRGATEQPEVSSSSAAARARPTPSDGEVEPDYQETVDGNIQSIQVYVPGCSSADLSMETVPRNGRNFISLVAPGRYKLTKEIQGSVVSAKFAKSKRARGGVLHRPAPRRLARLLGFFD